MKIFSAQSSSHCPSSSGFVFLLILSEHYSLQRGNISLVEEAEDLVSPKLASPVAYCVNSSKFLTLSIFQFSHLQDAANTHLLGLFRGLKETG